MAKSPKILFVTHDASRTGAPILLLKFIEWLINNKSIQVVIVAMHGGPLIPEFKRFGKCYVWNEVRDIPSLTNRIFLKLIDINQSLQHKNRIKRELRGENFDRVYINSAASLTLLDELNIQFPAANTILHVHELHSIIKQSQVENIITDSRIDRYIAVSDMVKDNLITNYKIQPGKIYKVREYIDLNDWPKASSKIVRKPPFIVAGIGHVHWRKGVEFFILMAIEIQKQGKLDDFEFWWIGSINDDDRIYLEEDLKKLGLQYKVKFLNEQKDLKDIYPKIAVLAITSREDPYPTVALEAACHNIPFVCWNQGIGTAELANKGCGISVNYFDTVAMANSILQLKEHPELLIQLGIQARKEAEKHDINIAGEQIFEIINQN